MPWLLLDYEVFLLDDMQKLRPILVASCVVVSRCWFKVFEVWTQFWFWSATSDSLEPAFDIITVDGKPWSNLSFTDTLQLWWIRLAEMSHSAGNRC